MRAFPYLSLNSLYREFDAEAGSPETASTTSLYPRANIVLTATTCAPNCAAICIRQVSVRTTETLW